MKMVVLPVQIGSLGQVLALYKRHFGVAPTGLTLNEVMNRLVDKLGVDSMIQATSKEVASRCHPD